MADGERLADDLATAELQALGFRRQLASLSMAWFGLDGVPPKPAPFTPRLIRLLAEPPVNASAGHEAAEVARFVEMHKALLADPDADLGDLPD